MRRVLVICAIALAFTATQALAGPMVKPYGFVLFNYQFNSAWNSDIPTVASEYEIADDPATPGVDESVELTKNHLLTARQTRLGFKVKLDSQFDPMGKVEFDFWGLRGSAPAGGVLQSAPRLRLAYMTFNFLDGVLKLTVGQDWVKAFAPLNPTSIAHVSIPEFSSSGNLWNRMPQIRADITQDVGVGTVMVQLAVVRPFAADLDPLDPYGTGYRYSTQGDALGAGELSMVPFGQGRVSFTYDDMVTVGVSGHAGRLDFSKRAARWVYISGDPINSHREWWDPEMEKVNSYAVAGDVSVSHDQVGFMGEGYWGQCLPMYFSNIGYGYISDWVTVSEVHHPAGLGGWGQIWVKPTEIIKLNAGGGIEMLDKDDLSSWSGWMGSVGQNLTIFANAMCMAVDGCVFSIEYGYIQTKRVVDASMTKAVFDADYEDEGAENHSVNVGFQLNF